MQASFCLAHSLPFPDHEPANKEIQDISGTTLLMMMGIGVIMKGKEEEERTGTFITIIKQEY